MSTTNFQPADSKRRPPQKSTRRKAQSFIEPIKAQIREAFANTEDSDHVSRFFGATARSTTDVVVAGQGVDIEDHGARIAVIESRLGLRKPMGVARGLALVRRSA